jgi:hypothetical protein
MGCRGIGELVAMPAWNLSTRRYETVYIDASQVSAVGLDGSSTFVDCGRSSFRTSLTVVEVMDLLTFKQRGEDA